jgi:hypothetical protein
VFEAEAVDEKCSCRAQVRYGQAGVVGVKGFAFKGSEYLKTRIFPFFKGSEYLKTRTIPNSP